MKKTLSILLALIVLTSLLTACGGSSTTPPPATPRPNPTAAPESTETPDETTTDEPENDEPEDDVPEARPPQDYIEGTDILPERWQGEWVVIFSAANYFDEDDSIYIIGYDNEVLYTDSSGRENKRWFSYSEEKIRFIYTMNHHRLMLIV